MEASFITKYPIVLWVLILSISLQAWPSTSCFEHEKAALLQLKSYFMSIASPTDSYLYKHKALSSWDSNGDGNCCVWHGVACNNSMQHVTDLDMSMLNIGGRVKTSPLNFSLFQAFEELKTLDLSENGITAFLGNEELSHLKKLEVLNLGINYLYGSVLGQELAHLKNLKILDLSDNNLNGSLSGGEGICKLRKLRDLSLGSNALSGSIPNCVWNLTSLRTIDLSGNNFNGELPPLINLPYLQFLSISENNFEGRVSLCHLLNLSSLEFLELSNNALSVEIGDPLCSTPSKLVDLGLRQCRLSGQSNTFPKFLSNQTNLVLLDLSSNGLVGLFPEWLLQNTPNLMYLILRNNSIQGSLEVPNSNNGNLSKYLYHLDVSSNKLKGEIPAHIGTVFPSLFYLNMSHNSIQGHIPASVGNLTIGVLDLSNNHLVGAVPRKLFSDSPRLAPLGVGLSFLLLSNNNLQGEIIPSYMNLSFLTALYLDNNNFGGTIQGSLRHSKQLQFLDISKNKAMGELPSWIEDLQFLESMSLAMNEFHGNVPSQLCKLQLLEFLDLSENRFTGGIPSCDKLLPLKFLHMHGNRLTGSIPEGLARLSSLVTFDLSNNHLSGGIPRWIDQLSNLVILSLGGNRLGGELPKQLCHLNYVNIIDLSNNEISGLIPACFRNLSFGAPELATLYTTVAKFTTGVYMDGYYLISDVVIDVYTRQEEADLIVKSGSRSYKGNILSLMSELDLSHNNLTGEIPPELGELGNIHALNLSYNHLSGSIPTSFSMLKSIESLDLSSNNLSGTIPYELVDLNFLEIFNVSYNNLSGEVPETGGQFGTFDGRNYQGNPLLCGSRLPKSCKTTELDPTGTTPTEEGDEGFDMEVFFWSFGMSSVIIFVALNVVLAINPYWRRAWFAFVDVKLLWWFHP